MTELQPVCFNVMKAKVETASVLWLISWKSVATLCCFLCIALIMLIELRVFQTILRELYATLTDVH